MTRPFIRGAVAGGLVLCLAGCGGTSTSGPAAPLPTPSPTVPLSPAAQREAKLRMARSVLLGGLRNSTEVMNAMLVLESLEKPVVVSEADETDSLTGGARRRVRERYPLAGLEVTRVDGQVLGVTSLDSPADFSSMITFE